MSKRLERFTTRARRVLSLAQGEAEKARHHLIIAEHILLGIYLEAEGIGGQTLRNKLGLSEKQVRTMVQPTFDQIPKNHLLEQHPESELAPSTKRVLELAVDDARRRGQTFIGTHHLLLGYIRLREKEIAPQYRQMGMSFKVINNMVNDVLSTDADPNEPVNYFAEAVTTEVLETGMYIRTTPESPYVHVTIDLTKLLGDIKGVHRLNYDWERKEITLVIEREPKSAEPSPETPDDPSI